MRCGNGILNGERGKGLIGREINLINEIMSMLDRFNLVMNKEDT